MFAVKSPCVLSRDTPKNPAHAVAGPLQVLVEVVPLPRSRWRNSAVIDHAPFKPISAPAPATKPALAKSLPPVNEAVVLVDPAGV